VQSIHLRKPSAALGSHRSQLNVASAEASSVVQKAYHDLNHQRCKSETPSRILYAASEDHMLDSAYR
jgi:hypothetical protein